MHKFIETCINGSDSNIRVFELKFQSNRFNYSYTNITLTVATYDPIAPELHV